MSETVRKLIEHKVKTGMSETEMCEEIGITRMTLYRIKKGEKKSHAYTMEQVENYIKRIEDGL